VAFESIAGVHGAQSLLEKNGSVFAIVTVPAAATLLQAMLVVKLVRFDDVSVLLKRLLRVDGVCNVPDGLAVLDEEGSSSTFPELPSTLKSQEPNCFVLVR
jgi:hypothetical protein